MDFSRCLSSLQSAHAYEEKRPDRKKKKIEGGAATSEKNDYFGA